MSAKCLRWIIGIGLASSAAFAYFGITSWSALRAKADGLRPTSALLLDHDELCQAQAHQVQARVVDQHRVNAEWKASQQKITAIKKDIARSQDRMAHMLEALEKGSDQIHVNNKVTRKRADVERELESQVRAHRRLEQRLAMELAKSDRLGGHFKTLTTVIDEQRALLSEMVAKSEAFAAASSMGGTDDQALVADSNAIEQEVIATRSRVRQLEGVIEGRLQPYLFSTADASDRQEVDWDLLSKHPDAASMWVAQAQEIIGHGNAHAQTAESSQNELVLQD